MADGLPLLTEVIAAYLATHGFLKTLPTFLSEAKLKTFQEKDGLDLESMYKNYVSSELSGNLMKRTLEKVKDIVKEKREIYQVVDTSRDSYSIAIEAPCQEGQQSNLVVGIRGLQKEGKRKRQKEVPSDEEGKQRKKKKRSVEESEKVTLESLEEGPQGVVGTTENGFKKGKEKLSKKKKKMEAQLEENGKDEAKKGIETGSTLLGEEDVGKSGLNGVIDEKNVELDIHKVKDGEVKEGELGDTMDGNILKKREEKLKKKKRQSQSAQLDIPKLNDGETIEGGHGDTPNEDGLNQKKDKLKKKTEAQSTPLEEQGELDVQKLKDEEPNEDGLNKRKDKSKKKKKGEEDGQENGSVDAKMDVNGLQSKLPEVVDSEEKDGRKQRKSKKPTKLSEEVQSALPNDGVDVKMDETSLASEFHELKEMEGKQSDVEKLKDEKPNEDGLNKRKDKSKKKKKKGEEEDQENGSVDAKMDVNGLQSKLPEVVDSVEKDGVDVKMDETSHASEFQEPKEMEGKQSDVEKLKDEKPNEDGLKKRKDKSKKKKKKGEEEDQENGSVDAKMDVNRLQSKLPEVVDSAEKDGRTQRKSKKSTKLSEKVQSALPNDGVDVKMNETSHASEFQELKEMEGKQLEKHGKKKKSKDTTTALNGLAEDTNYPEIGGEEPELDGLSEKKKQKKRKTKVAEENDLPQEVDNLVPSVKQNGDLTQVNSISGLLSENSQSKLQNGSNGAAEMENADQKMPKSLEKKPTGVLAFRRVDPEKVAFDDPRLQDNSYWAKAGAEEGWGAKAQGVLGTVRGKDFRHEKTKKKRGSYMGGKIDLQSHSVKFNFSDGE